MSTGDEGLYAPLSRLESFFGQGFLREFLGGQVETEETPASLRRLLVMATGKINSALQQGGYAVPIAPESVDPALADQINELLATHCCVLAGQGLTAGALNLPKGLKDLITDTTTWVDGVSKRRINLLGVSRPVADASPTAATLVQFVGTGERFFPLGWHDRARFIPR